MSNTEDKTFRSLSGGFRAQRKRPHIYQAEMNQAPMYQYSSLIWYYSLYPVHLGEEIYGHSVVVIYVWSALYKKLISSHASSSDRTALKKIWQILFSRQGLTCLWCNTDKHAIFENEILKTHTRTRTYTLASLFLVFHSRSQPFSFSAPLFGFSPLPSSFVRFVFLSGITGHVIKLGTPRIKASS